MVVGKTLHYAFQGLKLLRDACQGDFNVKSVPEIRLTISGDSILLEDLDGGKHYELLHFCDLQCSWMKIYNQMLMSSDKQLANSVKLTKHSADPLYQYFSQGKNDKTGQSLDRILTNAIIKYRRRMNSTNLDVTPRGIRVLFSTEEELIEAAKMFAIDKSSRLEFPRGEILNLWVPTEDKHLFAKIREWASCELSSAMAKKFYVPELNPLRTLRKFINNCRENSALDPFEEIEKHLTDDHNKYPFMFLFTGIHMYKEGYLDKEPVLCTDDESRKDCYYKFLQYFPIILMALHYRTSVSLASLVEQTRAAARSAGGLGANPNHSIEKIISGIRDGSN